MAVLFVAAIILLCAMLVLFASLAMAGCPILCLIPMDPVLPIACALLYEQLWNERFGYKSGCLARFLFAVGTTVLAYAALPVTGPVIMPVCQSRGIRDQYAHYAEKISNVRTEIERYRMKYGHIPCQPPEAADTAVGVIDHIEYLAVGSDDGGGYYYALSCFGHKGLLFSDGGAPAGCGYAVAEYRNPKANRSFTATFELYEVKWHMRPPLEIDVRDYVGKVDRDKELAQGKVWLPSLSSLEWSDHMPSPQYDAVLEAMREFGWEIR